MIKKVYITFKTHLDVGFTGLARDIEKKYLNDYFPTAIATADWFRTFDMPYKYVWTVGSWIISQGLDKLKGKRLHQLEAALAAGDIAWHALPFTMHTELCESSLFQYALSLSKRLDERFGITTVAAKMTDVPGHTRGMINHLAKDGVTLLHLGVNPASAMPRVPELFKWQDDCGNSLHVIYQSDYGQTLVLPKLGIAFHVDVTGDNMGPHLPKQAMNAIEKLHQKFPKAEICPCRMDDFAKVLLDEKPEVPVVTSEIGDTWIHGIGSDPAKVSRFRELCRLRSKWQEDGVSQNDLEKFSRKLLEVAEHTWGLDEKTFLPQNRDYSKNHLAKIRQSSAGKLFEKSWQEQRNFVKSAVAFLPAELQRQARASLKKIAPEKPSLGKHCPVNIAEKFETSFFVVQFDAHTGAMIYLMEKKSGKVLVNNEHAMFDFSYQTFSGADYRRFMKQYLRTDQLWAIEDFSKPGLPTQATLSHTYSPKEANLYSSSTEDAYLFCVKLTMPDKAVQNYGCPADVFLEYKFCRNSFAIDVKCQWFNKQAYRGPEALWLKMSPCISKNARCYIEKLGHTISPTDVVSRGARGLHCVTGKIELISDSGNWCIESDDATLVAFGKPGLLDFNNLVPEISAGVHFNLYNNVWGTNFPMWYDADASFRFKIVLNLK